MKIAIDARELRTSTGRYIERLIYYLQSIDHENDYVVLLTPKDFESWEPSNPHFQKVVCPYKEFTFSEQFGFRKQLKHLNAGLVHFGMVQQPILYSGKCVTTMHDLTATRFRNPSKNWFVFTIKQQVYKAVNWYVPRKSQKIIVPSEYVKKDVVAFAHVNESKIAVTYEGADAITDPPEVVPLLINKQFIMYVGRPQRHKNLERLIDAFVLLKKTRPELMLVLAGRNDVLYKRIAERVVKNGVSGVIFTDYISEGQLRWLYEHCQAYIFPSLSEGFGLPGLEAMVHGAPVVSSNATCLPEVYGEAAHYFDPTNTVAIAQSIEDVLGDQNLRNNLINAGKKQVNKYSWQKMASQTLVVYKDVNA